MMSIWGKGGCLFLDYRIISTEFVTKYTNSEAKAKTLRLRPQYPQAKANAYEANAKVLAWGFNISALYWKEWIHMLQY